MQMILLMLMWTRSVFYYIVFLSQGIKPFIQRLWFHLAGKVDPYAELVVDGQPPRKTDVVRKTWEPKWMEDFTM